MNESISKIMLYIQQAIYDGKKANESGYYCFSRNELAKETGLSVSTITKRKEELIYALSHDDIFYRARFKGLQMESLYVNVSFAKGELKFQRNPLTNQSEYAFLWGLPPLDPFYAYDVFDNKHRRRHNGSPAMKFDSVAWSLDADQFESAIAEARKANEEHRLHCDRFDQ